MKNKLFLVMAIVLISTLVLSACGQQATPTQPAAATEAPAPAGEKPIMAISLMTLDWPMMVSIGETMKKTFGDVYDVQVASAELDPVKQAQQVENFTAMKAKLLFAIPVEASSLVPKLVEARKAGVKVYVAGGDPGNPDAYDSVVELNEWNVGLLEAYMAKQWVDATYPDAADGSIETAVLEATDRPLNVTRTRAIELITEPYLKNEKGEYVDLAGKVVAEADKVANPVYSPKVKIVATAEGKDLATSQGFTQNFLTQYPNLKLILAMDSQFGMGASQAMVDEYNKGTGSVIKDLSKVAVFGAGAFSNERQLIRDSIKNNNSVYRGTIKWGVGNVPVDQDIFAIQSILDGTAQKHIMQPIFMLTPGDNQVLSTALDSDVFKIPDAAPQPVPVNP
jgi:ribose transport system substrate-binding protein